MRIICDLDDTLALTTLTLKGIPEKPERLKLVPGADAFLKKYGELTLLLTAGSKEWQLQKISALKIAHRVSGIVVVPDYTKKCSVIEQIISEHDSAHHTIIIGDRLDAEIVCGNQHGALTIRLTVEGGRYRDFVPSTVYETPSFTVVDFYGVIQVLSNLHFPHTPSHAHV